MRCFCSTRKRRHKQEYQATKSDRGQGWVYAFGKEKICLSSTTALLSHPGLLKQLLITLLHLFVYWLVHPRKLLTQIKERRAKQIDMWEEIRRRLSARCVFMRVYADFWPWNQSFTVSQLLFKGKTNYDIIDQKWECEKPQSPYPLVDSKFDLTIHWGYFVLDQRLPKVARGRCLLHRVASYRCDRADRWFDRAKFPIRGTPSEGWTWFVPSMASSKRRSVRATTHR